MLMIHGDFFPPLRARNLVLKEAIRTWNSLALRLVFR